MFAMVCGLYPRWVASAGCDHEVDETFWRGKERKLPVAEFRTYRILAHPATNVELEPTEFW